MWPGVRGPIILSGKRRVILLRAWCRGFRYYRIILLAVSINTKVKKRKKKKHGGRGDAMGNPKSARARRSRFYFLFFAGRTVKIPRGTACIAGPEPTTSVHWVTSPPPPTPPPTPPESFRKKLVHAVDRIVLLQVACVRARRYALDRKTATRPRPSP